MFPGILTKSVALVLFRLLTKTKMFWPILFIIISINFAFTTSGIYADVRSIHEMDDQINKIIFKKKFFLPIREEIF